jgi:hypothetical protein
MVAALFESIGHTRPENIVPGRLQPRPVFRARHTDVRETVGEDHPTWQLRDVLDRVGDKCCVLVMNLLGGGPKRYSELQRSIEGISQRMLTLRSLERDGLAACGADPTDICGRSGLDRGGSLLHAVRSEHSVGNRGGFRHRLEDIPMLDDLPVDHPPDVDDGDAARVIVRGHVVVHHHVLVVSDDPLEFEPGAGHGSLGDERDERLPT